MIQNNFPRRKKYGECPLKDPIPGDQPIVSLFASLVALLLTHLTNFGSYAGRSLTTYASYAKDGRSLTTYASYTLDGRRLTTDASYT
jgi:hypothetical protein